MDYPCSIRKIAFISILLVFVTFVIHAQQIKCVYRVLNKFPLEYSIIPDSSILFSEGFKQDTFRIKEDNIMYLKSTYFCPEPPYTRDTIVIDEKSFCIDQLFYNDESIKIENEEEPLRLMIETVYSILFMKKKYICLFLRNSQIPENRANYYIIFIDNSIKSIRPILLGPQASYTPECFGDFNNDGKLDYIEWRSGNLFTKNIYIYSYGSNLFFNGHMEPFI